MANSTANSGELTTEQIQKILVEPLQQRSRFLEAGPRIFDTDGSPVRIPKAAEEAPAEGAGALEWVGENAQIPEHDVNFSEVKLLPSGMKSVKTLTRYSNELARQSVVNLDAAIKDRLVRDVAGKLDSAFLGAEGDGVETPQGMFAWTDTQEMETVGALDLDALMDAFGLALAADVDVDALRLFIRPEHYMILRKLKDLDGRYLIVPDVSAGKLVVPALGAEAIISKRVAAGSAALVDMSQVAVARDMAPTVKILAERYADYDQQAIRTVARYDAKPINPEAVVKLTGITG